jgi:hypothetical protein
LHKDNPRFGHSCKPSEINELQWSRGQFAKPRSHDFNRLEEK